MQGCPRGHLSLVGTRVFTVAEANELVPKLEEGFRLVLRLRAELRRAYARLEQAGHAPSWESLRAPGDVPEEIRTGHGRFLALAMAMAEQFEAVMATGVQVKDPETGLCDFPSVREGRPVQLCWRLGEPAVEFWHELGAGFAGRLPLESDAPPHAPQRGGDA